MANEANQTQIPVIQSDNQDIVQLQQNTNKVLRNLNNQITELNTANLQMTIIGEIKIANLTQDQFQDFAGTNWLICNGQTCVGSDYSRLTGNNAVPTITVSGVNTFIRIN